MKHALVLTLMAFFLITACKKSKNEVSLMGKWTIESINFKEYNNGVLIDEETESDNGATMDFQNNGNMVVTHSPGNTETVPYTIKSGSTVEIDGDVYDIRNLTASSVTLFNRDNVTANYYFEYTATLKR